MKTFISLFLLLCVAAIVAQNTNPAFDNRAFGKRINLIESGKINLKDGSAKIKLETPIEDYYVVITPLGPCGQLYISEKTESGFTIKETQVGNYGKSDISLEFMVLASPPRPQPEMNKSDNNQKQGSPQEKQEKHDKTSEKKK